MFYGAILNILMCAEGIAHTPQTALDVLSELNTQPYYINLLLSDTLFRETERELWKTLFTCEGKEFTPLVHETATTYKGRYPSVLEGFESNKNKLKFVEEPQNTKNAHDFYQELFNKQQSVASNPPISVPMGSETTFIHDDLLTRNVYLRYKEGEKDSVITKIIAFIECLSGNG